MIRTLILLSWVSACVGGPLPVKFIQAVHQVETGGRLGPILGDAGRALGPFQIHRSYWKDSGLPGRYEDCANYEYAVKVMTAVLNRYAPKAVASQDLKTLARVHNGGPQGAKRTATLKYWERVRRAYERTRNS
jgi:hypothetical protein